jgi:hypothetical protein
MKNAAVRRILLPQGYTVTSIARHFGCSTQAVRDALRFRTGYGERTTSKQPQDIRKYVIDNGGYEVDAPGVTTGLIIRIIVSGGKVDRNVIERHIMQKPNHIKYPKPYTIYEYDTFSAAQNQMVNIWNGITINYGKPTPTDFISDDCRVIHWRTAIVTLEVTQF